MHFTLFVVSAVVALAAPAALAAVQTVNSGAKAHSAIIAFGDSFSDNGSSLAFKSDCTVQYALTCPLMQEMVHGPLPTIHGLQILISEFVFCSTCATSC